MTFLHFWGGLEGGFQPSGLAGFLGRPLPCFLLLSDLVFLPVYLTFLLRILAYVASNIFMRYYIYYSCLSRLAYFPDLLVLLGWVTSGWELLEVCCGNLLSTL